MIRKWLAIGIILLFVGVTIAPTINFNTVKASTDDDLVEVTTRGCNIELLGVKRGSVKIHFFEDLDNDSIFDCNEPSPPILRVQLKTHHFVVNRIKLIGFRGNAIFRFLPYPDNYYLKAYFQRDPDGLGIMTEIWMYSGELYLNESVMGNTLYLPIRHIIMPIKSL